MGIVTFVVNTNGLGVLNDEVYCGELGTKASLEVSVDVYAEDFFHATGSDPEGEGFWVTFDQKDPNAIYVSSSRLPRTDITFFTRTDMIQFLDWMYTNDLPVISPEDILGSPVEPFFKKVTESTRSMRSFGMFLYHELGIPGGQETYGSHPEGQAILCDTMDAFLTTFYSLVHLDQELGEKTKTAMCKMMVSNNASFGALSTDPRDMDELVTSLEKYHTS